MENKLEYLIYNYIYFIQFLFIYIILIYKKEKLKIRKLLLKTKYFIWKKSLKRNKKMLNILKI